jgi:hypothetical protein
MEFESEAEKTDPSPRTNRGVRDNNFAAIMPNRVALSSSFSSVIFSQASRFSRAFYFSMLRFSIWTLGAERRSRRDGRETSPRHCALCLRGERTAAASEVRV